MKNRRGTASAQHAVRMMITLTVVLFIGAVSFVFYNNKTISQSQARGEQNQLVATASSQPLSDLEKDTDGDGLADWEEILWSTDPNKADTDGDGVQDKEQIANSQKLASNSNPDDLSLQVNTSDDTPLTLTEIASRELFTSYMFTLQNNETPTVAETEAMADNAIRKIVPLVPRSTFTAEKVTVLPATQDNRKQYVLALASVLDQIHKNVANENESLFKMANGNRAEGIEELKVISKEYQKYIEDLKSISVPSDATQIHVAMVSKLENYVLTLEGFTYFETDPMRSAISIQTIQNAFSEFEHSLVKLSKYVLVNNLTGLSPSEIPNHL